MTTTVSPAPEILNSSRLRAILRTEGPCISIFLPAYHPGESASTAALLKSYLHQLDQWIGASNLPEQMAQSLVEPLKALINDSSLAAGGRWGHAIFRSPAVLKTFRVSQPLRAELNIGGCFAIRQLVHGLTLPQLSCIATISQKKISLIKCNGMQAEITPLPPGIPKTMADAIALEPPDHDLENRSFAGHTTGSMHAVRFGTGSEREREDQHLADYYRIVDRGLKSAFEAARIPIVLAGVDEDIAVYMSVSDYPYLCKRSIRGSMDVVRNPNIVMEAAYAALHAENDDEEAAILQEAEAHYGIDKFSKDLNQLLGAAFAGRLQKIYLDARAQKIGTFESANYRSFGQEDLLNLAAVQTLAHGGTIAELSSNRLPVGSPAFGLMRY